MGDETKYDIHDTVKRSFWHLASWRLADVRHLLLSDKMQNPDPFTNPLNDTLMDMAMHRLDHPSTSIHPVSETMVQNIQPTVGLQDSAKRDAGLISTSLTHHAVGTGTTEPALGDTAMEAEVGRKSILSIGVSGTTGSYSTIFLPTDISGLGASNTINITEAGILDGASSAARLQLHVTGDAQPISAGELITVAASLTYLNGDDTS